MSESVKISPRGQVVIPSKIRKKLGLEAGGSVFIEEKNGLIILEPAGLALAKQRKKFVADLDKIIDDLDDGEKITDAVAAVRGIRR